MYKVITFNLTAEGANSFKVYAVDKFGRKSPTLERNFGLNIDRGRPIVNVYGTVSNKQVELNNIAEEKWISSNGSIAFWIKYSDGEGVGTQKLHWSVNGEERQPVTLNANAGYGVTYNMRYTTLEGNDVTVDLREGWENGLVSKNDLDLTPTELAQLVSARILAKMEGGGWGEGNYYTWNNVSVAGSNSNDFYTERELITKLDAIKFAKKQNVINAWRYYTDTDEHTAINKRDYKMQVVDRYEFQLHEDGYHRISVNVMDKFGYISEDKTFGWIVRDTGYPDIQVDLGGSFQSEWYVGGMEDYSTGPLNELTGEDMEPSGIMIKAEVGDMFGNNVLVTQSYYPGVNIPHYYENTRVRTPGSGVKRVTVWTKTNSDTGDDIVMGDIDVKHDTDPTKTRFGLKINKYNFDINRFDNIRRDDFIITRNGINMIKYAVWDQAGNANMPYEDDVKNRQWNEVLRSYVYPSDKNVIRGLKVDTLPPFNLKLEIVTASFYNKDTDKSIENAYTDTLQGKTGPDGKIYEPLYTNRRRVPVRFYGEDEGIGVRYAYFSALENGVSWDAQQGVTYSYHTDQGVTNDSSEGTGDNYVKTDEWVDIAKLTGSPEVASKEQGILKYANYRTLLLGEEQGTRNLTLRMADDFGLDYYVSRSSIEEVSATFNYDDPEFATVNYISTSVLERGLYHEANNPTGGYVVKGDTTGGYYFISGGWLDMPTKNRAVGENKDGGYYIRKTTITSNVDGKETLVELKVYFWDPKIPGREDHRSLAVISPVGTVTADRLIVYDSTVNISAIMPVTLPIAELTKYDPALKGQQPGDGLWISKIDLTVGYAHDEKDELSGITHIRFGGDIVSVRPATINQSVTESYKPGDWVPYAYRSQGITNNYIVTVANPLVEGPRKVSITGMRDRASNNVTAEDMHFVEFYYDVAMPRNPKGRYFIKNQNGSILNEKYYVGVPTYNLEFSFNGAYYYDVLEYSDDKGHNSLVSGSYNALPALDGKQDWKVINDIVMVQNRDDGPKSLVLRLFDRGTQDMTEGENGNMVVITYNHWVDNTPPTLSITGLQDKDTTWYTPRVAFNLNVTDNGAGIASIVYEIRNDYTHTADRVTRSYTFDSGERYPKFTSLKNIEITRRGANNRVNIWVEDGVGNRAAYQTDGIKVHDSPPAISVVRPLQGTLSGNVIYTNQKVLPLQVLGDSIDHLQFTAGNIQTQMERRNSSNTYNVTIAENSGANGADGARTLNIKVYDELYVQFSSHNPLSAKKSYTVILDSLPPSFSVESIPDMRISVVDDAKVISGLIEDIEDGNDIPSPVQVFYQINNTMQVWPAIVSGNTWTIYVRDVIEQSGRHNGNYSLRIYAQDLAGNRSAVSDAGVDGRVAAFSVPDGYIMAQRGMVIRGLDVGTTTNVDEQQQAMQMASSKLGGVKYAPELDKTALPVVQETPTVSPTGNIVLTYTEEAERRVEGKTDTFRIFYLDPLKNEWVLVPGQEAKETNGIAAHDKEKRTLSAPLIGFGMYRIFDTTTFADDLKEVHMFPNPYKGSDGDLANGEDGVTYRDRIVIENITETTRAKIYTISGELVTTLEDPDVAKRSLEWDLTNSRGARVASGIYIILLTDAEGHRFLSRLTVVR
jgi:hypothetical protein